MKSILQLPIADSPIIGLQYIAYPLCILLNYEESFPWFYSNYIQILWSTKYNSSPTFFPESINTNPLLGVQYIKKQHLARHNISIHALIKESLESNQYIYSKFDEFYVPNRLAYGEVHYIHDFLLYGYDLDNSEYFLLGYNEKQHFAPTRISFSEFEKAFFSTHNEDPGLDLINANLNTQYDFDVTLVCEMLDDYLNSRNSSERCRVYGVKYKDYVFGMGLYEPMKGYFQSMKDSDEIIDLRLLHVLYEHKKCMSMRIKYMLENNYLDKNTTLYDDYVKIENKTLEIRNLQIKYNLHRNISYLDRTIQALTAIEAAEKALLEDLLNMLSRKKI